MHRNGVRTVSPTDSLCDEQYFQTWVPKITIATVATQSLWEGVGLQAIHLGS